MGDSAPLESSALLAHGGMGSRSVREEQPDFLPDKYETGTAKAVGIARLLAGVRYVLSTGFRPSAITRPLSLRGSSKGCGRRQGVTAHGPLDLVLQTATVSFTVEGMRPSDMGLRLDEEYGILCRVGLHCSPVAHRTLGTFRSGTVRFGLFFSNDRQQFQAAARAAWSISTERGRA